MTKPNDIEIEIDEIRDKICKITQKMSAQERVDYINSHAHEILRKQQKSHRDPVRMAQNG
jgi:FtsZ-binding cell division protein ZapB